jgi:hypothetical protein
MIAWVLYVDGQALNPTIHRVFEHKLQPGATLRFGYVAGGGDEATDATYSNIQVYFKPEHTVLARNRPLEESAPDYTLGVQFRLEDEETSQGVLATLGDPNGTFEDTTHAAIVLRLEDAPDPP